MIGELSLLFAPVQNIRLSKTLANLQKLWQTLKKFDEPSNQTLKKFDYPILLKSFKKGG
jgi:hypothetical protein